MSAQGNPLKLRIPISLVPELSDIELSTIEDEYEDEFSAQSFDPGSTH